MSNEHNELSEELFTFCDRLLNILVKDSPSVFCVELIEEDEVVADFVLRARAHGDSVLGVKSTTYYLAHALRSMYNACRDWERVTPAGISARTRTFIGLFDRLCAEEAFVSTSANSAAHLWE